MIALTPCPTCGHKRKPHNLALVQSGTTYCECSRPERRPITGLRRENGVIVLGDFNYDAWDLSIEMGEREDRCLNAPGV